MEVYALVGSSGTGKSHRAMVVAYEHDIDTIIDDGLLIKEGCKLAGKSAKREATALQAVKRAIFLDKEHAAEVKKCLQQENPERILILGTSLRMVQRIADSLGIPRPAKVITIEDVATDQEIKLAQNLRETHGMHVIPVPTIEIKKDFPGYLVDPLKYFFRRKNEARRTVGEKSIIRPKFSLIGKLVISEHAVSQIVTYVTLQIPGVTQVQKVQVEMNEEGVRIRQEIVVRFGLYLPDVGRQVKTMVEKHLESITGLIVFGVEVVIKSLEIKEN
ncbi:MAG: Asp23/Gls24 family envelope stress response protein [Clostridia bacterium]|jgi:uncharacterized alkaline shock family protein YloU|nr:Asp23/Gls24 family envelope stress response protein [Clostridia bacterium]